MDNNKEEELIRENYDHGTDTYVSDSHRVPNFFAWPKILSREHDDNDDRFPITGCLISIAFIIISAWVCYRLGRLIIAIIF